MAATGDSSGSSVRKRHVEGRNPEPERKESGEKHGEEPGEEPEKDRRPQSLHPGTFWLTRVVLLRSVACIYLVAFSVAFNQNKQLIGERGLMPCRSYLSSVKRYVGGKIGMAAFAYTPSLLWLLDWSEMDANLDALAVGGMALSAVVLVTGTANMVIMASLWVLYHSLSQLLETGFLSIFLCPLWTLSQVPPRCPPSLISIWTFRWLIVRIMLGAGLIKIRGDKCWRDLTCMDYHYECTQPVPNPMSYYMHFSPWWFHRFETISTTSSSSCSRSSPSSAGGCASSTEPSRSCSSGNLSFLNWLTIVPSLACFDDAAGFLFSSKSGAKKAVLEIQQEEAAGRTPKPSKGMFIRSRGERVSGRSDWLPERSRGDEPVQLQAGDEHLLRPLRIVNTYGAFGRPEALWEEYQFLCKPGDVQRRPCFISPYHYRLDWLMWFAAFQTYEQSEWVIHIAGRLLSNDSSVLSLIDYNPFQGRETPSAAEGKWWLRKRIGAYFPAVDLEGLRGYFQSRSWPHPHLKPGSRT
ncbi:hypothetical protein F7725_013912 [Dissostichus mawsoni]|uniref:Lipase maturation factor n=1 Tax=Dissostichus mawsoni TaxID=36200 RepID=A0A7J5YUF9_DISMA|nr:hypothetical protein F7725_013912 [Dissostichus mawsoni]